MSLGLRLQLAREKLGLTEEDVAKAANMRTRYYSSIEADEIERPNPLTLQKLADALSVTLDYILGNEEERGDELSDILNPTYYKFINLVMRLIICLGTATLIASCVILATFSVRAISGMIPDKLSQTASLDAELGAISTSASSQAYIGSPTPLHLPLPVLHLEHKSYQSQGSLQPSPQVPPTPTCAYAKAWKYCPS